MTQREQKLMADAMAILHKLRDYHDETCEFQTCCGDSVEADRVATEIESVLTAKGYKDSLEHARR